MCKQIKKIQLNKPKKQRKYPKIKYQKGKAIYPEEQVQIDVKYVPNEYIGFISNHNRYYQITSIDKYSKKYTELADKHTIYITSNFPTRIETNLGFKIKLVQTDNGSEFVTDPERTDVKSRFQEYCSKILYKIISINNQRL